LNVLSRYTRWLHTRWPAGTVEKLPAVGEGGTTNVPGLLVVGDLTGIPLLKFSADTGAKAVKSIHMDGGFQGQRREKDEGVHDLAIIGGGVSGFAAALEAKRLGLDFVLLEASEPFSTIANFPKGKPIYTYPTAMVPEGEIQFEAEVKEDLLAELRQQTLEKGIEPRSARAEKVTRSGKVFTVDCQGAEDVRARRVVVAIGRSGNFRRLDVPGEDLDKVNNRLHDPKEFDDEDVLVVGGGDSALEAAVALAQAGARVVVSYRKPQFSRPKPENVERLAALAKDPMADVAVDTPSSERQTTSSGAFLEEHRKPGSITLEMESEVVRIDDDTVTLETKGGEEKVLPNHAVFPMIGREPPLDFFRKSGVKIRGETRGLQWLWVILFFLAVWFIYDWKNDGFYVHEQPEVYGAHNTFPKSLGIIVADWGEWWREQVVDRSTLIGTTVVSMSGRAFWYTLAYSAAIVGFGIARIRRRRTPYVTLQTVTLMAVQVLPLFLLPEIILPWLGHNGVFDSGMGASFADSLFPRNGYDGYYGHPRDYWRAYGLILAWPLSVYNTFTAEPLWAWIAIGFVQTFVLIPIIVWKWGKGSFCGWICSCGGLAETAGDTLRDRMPHGVIPNRLNMVGQGILLLAFVLLAVRIVGWMLPGSWVDQNFNLILEGKNADGQLVNPLAWKWAVDVLLGGILGVGLYIKYSGRVWCRFACPLAALMHVYARFTKFRIFADKKKCISCNVCTSMCHMGIDVMNFANKGLPMADPQCVRCSACVQSCPTGVLQFGEIDRKTGEELRRDSLPASPVRMREKAKS